MRSMPPNVPFRPAFGPLTQHFHISTLNAAAFTKQRKPTFFDRRRHGIEGRTPRHTIEQMTDRTLRTLKASYPSLLFFLVSLEQRQNIFKSV